MRIFLVLLLAAASLVDDPPVVTTVPPIDGYVWASQPANPDYLASATYAHNSANGAVQVVRSGAGAYQVRFLGMAGIGGVAHTQAYGGNGYCTVASWMPWLGDELVNVRCFTHDGFPADSRFIADVTNRTDGDTRGYLWSNDPTPPVGGYTPPATWSFDSAGEPIVVRTTGTGDYEVDLGAFAQDSPDTWKSGSLRVTPYGTSPTTCQVYDPDFYDVPGVILVHCFDPTGASVNSRFTLSYGRGVVAASATVDNFNLDAMVTGWSSPSGVAPTGTNLGGGEFLVTFPGVVAPGGHAYATFGMTPPMFCVVGWWLVIQGALQVRVRCFDPGGGKPNTVLMLQVGFST